jgi:hypothetical protein
MIVLGWFFGRPRELRVCGLIVLGGMFLRSKKTRVFQG